MIDISKWSVEESPEVDPVVIVARQEAWQSQIAKLSDKERRQLIQERQRRAKVLRETSKTRNNGRSILKNAVRALPKARPFPKQRPDTREWKCETCKDLGFIGSRDSLPHWHPEFGQAVLCPHCGHAKKRVTIERKWPLGEATRALYQKPIRTRNFCDGQWVTQEPLVELKHTLKEFIKHLPTGVLILIEGGYGTVKTHSLAILYDRCFQAGRSAIYVNATDLEKVYTDFSESQRSSYDEIRNEASFTRFNREKSLMETDFLFIDEAHRYTQRGGNGWTERQLFNLVRTRLDNNKTIVMAGNILKPKGRNPGLHPAILDRVKADGCKFISLEGVPSGREEFSRHPSAGWDKRQG